MPDSRTCGKCGATLSADLALNVCPRCVAAQVFLDDTSPVSTDAGADPAGTILIHALNPVEQQGDRIGRYKILQKIGEGGCGVVYLAEQEEPVRRRVALKVIKLGMDTRQVVARFEAERQALAMMDHPNIAKVHDGGTTATGRPYFVMELVRGVRFTDYCDENHLPTAQRLDLFTQVCHAVQHAHQKGIIHRDLKPSNILITINDGVPVPKVIDFGVAKAVEQRLTDKTLFTEFHQFIGTPAYMSPEQALMTSLDIDTRSDIYSLGVLLYELLTGRTPLDTSALLKAGLEEMRRTIREQEPPRPSNRLSTLPREDLTGTAKRRSTNPPQLIHAISGDLDWIVMKCLEKDRTRRYETANGLAADLKRHLHSEPINARPPSTLYTFQKLVQRNKVAFSAAAAVALALLVGIITTSWQAIRARAAEREQKRLRVEAEASLGMLRQMVLAADPWNGGEESRSDIRVRELLDQIVNKLDRGAATNSPSVEASMRHMVGVAFVNMGRHESAVPQLKRALEIRRRLYGNQSERVAEVLSSLAVAHDSNANSARVASEEALTIRRNIGGENHRAIAYSLMNLANFVSGDEKQRRLREAMEIYRSRGETNSANWYDVITAWVLMLRDQGQLQQSIEVFEPEIVSMKKNQAVIGSPVFAKALLVQAHNLTKVGETNRVEAMYREALEIFYRRADPSSFFPTDCMWRLVEFLVQTRQYDQAEKVLLDHDRYLLSDTGHLKSAELKHILRIIQFYRRYMPHKADAFEPRLATLHPKAWTELSFQSPSIAPEDIDFISDYADLAFRARRYSEAEPFYRRLLDVRLSRTNQDQTMTAKASLGRCLTELVWTEHNRTHGIASDPKLATRLREAELLLRESFVFRVGEVNSSRGKRGDTRSRLGGAILVAAVLDLNLTPETRLARFAEAESLLLEGQEFMEQSTSVDSKYKRDGMERLVRLYEAWNKRDQAAEWQTKLAALRRTNAAPQSAP